MKTLPEISYFRLSIAFILPAVVTVIFFLWTDRVKRILYALARMFIQLMLIGYVLIYIFKSDSPAIIGLTLCVMVSAASWIVLGSVHKKYKLSYPKILAAIIIAGGTTLVIITQAVIVLKPWYFPQYVIPLAGMIFANSMNSVSLAAERVISELTKGQSFKKARQAAFQASLIPITNSLFAVGLVSLPGLMTGQILSGVSPLIAARYQIVVMLMIFGSSGLASALFLIFTKSDIIKIIEKEQDEQTEQALVTDKRTQNSTEQVGR